ncbi:MAG: hypothetical protein Kow0070_28630 [Anaerolineales bacterium]
MRRGNGGALSLFHAFDFRIHGAALCFLHLFDLLTDQPVLHALRGFGGVAGGGFVCRFCRLAGFFVLAAAMAERKPYPLTQCSRHWKYTTYKSELVTSTNML